MKKRKITDGDISELTEILLEIYSKINVGGKSFDGTPFHNLLMEKKIPHYGGIVKALKIKGLLKVKKEGKNDYRYHWVSPIRPNNETSKKIIDKAARISSQRSLKNYNKRKEQKMDDNNNRLYESLSTIKLVNEKTGKGFVYSKGNIVDMLRDNEVKNSKLVCRILIEQDYLDFDNKFGGYIWAPGIELTKERAKSIEQEAEKLLKDNTKEAIETLKLQNTPHSPIIDNKVQDSILYLLNKKLNVFEERKKSLTHGLAMVEDKIRDLNTTIKTLTDLKSDI